jgi:hypothetical protein
VGSGADQCGPAAAVVRSLHVHDAIAQEDEARGRTTPPRGRFEAVGRVERARC